MSKKLILKSNLSPGDIVMLTAAVRDLHATYPGEYLTDVRTPCPALWEHNPHITRITDEDPEARVVEMHYPLIQRSNAVPYHFIHGYRMHLEHELGRRIEVGTFRGDVYLSPDERGWLSQVEEIEGGGTRYWIIVAGGKRDFTAKWWDPARYQAVVDHFKGRIRFVQAGEAGHAHPTLRGVLDLRGQTTLRQLVRLVHHADGVLCPVTSLMHLAAAVPVREGRAPLRPCVVVAGGREPAQWEAYPGHRYLDTIGALPCCASGGCWKSRVVPMGDGDEKDKSLCLRPVEVSSGLEIPQCLELVSVDAVIRAVESYLVVPAPERETVRALPVQNGDGASKSCCGRSGRKGVALDRNDPRAWGPVKWRELHERADKAGDLGKEKAWLERFRRSLPCADCREHFTTLLAEQPPKLESCDTYFAWTVEAHNAVNRRLGKAEVSLEVASEDRVKRRSTASRWTACKRCEHFAEANRNEGPRCMLAGWLRSFVNDPQSVCPSEKWGAVLPKLLGKRTVVEMGVPGESRVGLVIGTYGAVPYIHLQLESLRRFHPGTPCLVVDDGSPQREQLAELCREYGVEFIGRDVRMGHVAGDMTAFVVGHEWAQRNDLDILVKFSRRWVPLVPWIDEVRRIMKETHAPTLCNRCEFHGFGFRSECVAMDVSKWKQADALKPVRENIRRAREILSSGVTADKQHVFLVEGIIHEASHRASKVGGRQWGEHLREHPPRGGCEHYVEWPLMGHNRRHRKSSVIWHEWARPEEYHLQLLKWGVDKYTACMMLDSAGNIHGALSLKRLINKEQFWPIFQRIAGRRIAYVQLPGNWGDRLIDLGAKELFREFNTQVVDIGNFYAQDHGMAGISIQSAPGKPFVQLTPQVLGFHPDASKIDCIVVAGGGSMGTFYKNSAAIRRHLLGFGKPVIVLPSTFTDSDPQVRDFEAVYIREHGSLLHHSTGVVLPDLALAVTPRISKLPTKVRGLFLRHDSEALFTKRLFDADPHSCRTFDDYISMAEIYSSIVTDCLHFAIAGLHFGRSVTLHPGSIHKNHSMWKSWLSHLGVKWKESL